MALREWAREIRAGHPEVVRIGYFGSYARGDWGVGSDLDIVVIVEKSDLPRERRSLVFDKEDLPVPADLLVYSQNEWNALSASESRFARMLREEAVWIE